MSTVSTTALVNSLLLLESDIDALGWDRPAALYQIRGDVDPIIEKLSELPSPRKDLQRLALRAHPPASITGLTVVTEAWSTLPWEMAMVTVPELAELSHAELIEANSDVFTGNETVEELNRLRAYGWTLALVDAAESVGGVGNLPPHLRLEVRTVITSLRDGTTIVITRIRDDEPEVTTIASGTQECGLTATLLRTMLGVTP